MRANLAPSRPNPFGGMAQIRFGLSATGPVALQVFDAGGRLVRTLVEGTLAAGFHTTSWSGETDAGRSAASGIYFYRLKTAQGTLQRSMVLMR